jgi:septal ring factor EnvC (AmiA/AmiB activator)
VSALISQLGLCGLLFLALVVAAPPAAAADDMESKRQHWVQRYETLRAQEKELREGLEEARAEYSRGRRKSRPRGEERAELVEKIEKLETDLAQAQRDLEAFPEKARQAGALPGWFRDLDS